MEKSGIFCLESLWNPDTSSQRSSVRPMVEFIGRQFQVKHTTFDCSTPEELHHRLQHGRKVGYGILYFAMHGNNGILKTNGGLVTLEDVARTMGDRYYGWFLHFGSCSTLNVKMNELKSLKRHTGVASISGYKKDVDWTDSAVLDLAWLSYLAYGRRTLPPFYNALMSENKFVCI